MKMNLNDGYSNERRRGGRGRSSHRGGGAKTFRRGRAIAFLESMKLKRTTIQQQLEQPEYQTIQQVLVGELKAIDMVISEFSQLFDIHETEIEGDHQNLLKDNELEKEKDSNETN